MGKEYVDQEHWVKIQDIDVGDTFITRSRVITRSDVECFATSNGFTLPFFLSERAAKEAGLESQLAPGLLTASLCVGLLIQSGFIGTVIASMGIDQLRFTQPVYVYDEIRVEAEVTAKKQTSKGTWVCSYKWTVKNQRNEGVASGINT